MTYGPDTRRYTLFVRPKHHTTERPWSWTVHADEACARFRGSRAFILEVTALGDTLAEAAKDGAADYSLSGVRICSRCTPR
jgi:hypothetical protein